MPHSHSTLRLVKANTVQQLAHEAVTAYKRQQQLVAEREAIADIATVRGHVLGPWRLEGSSTTALVQCWCCGEGARLDLDAACAHLTAGLTQPCQGVPSQHTRVTGEVI